MAGLTVDFTVDAKLVDAIANFKTSTDRALLVGIDNERLVFLNAVTGTQSETVDMSKVRTAAAGIPAAFIIFRRASGGSYALITYVSDDAKPRVKMMFSASAQHLRKTFDAPFSSDKRVTAAADLTPSLFSHEQTDRQELMTDSEKAKAQIAAMLEAEAAADAAKGVASTAPRALPGMAAAVSADVDTAIRRVATNDENAAVMLAFADAKSQSVSVAGTVGPIENALDFVSALAQEMKDQPLFAFLRCDSLNGGASEAAGKPKANHLVYFCPAVSKPKDKMRFSASKGSLVMHIKNGMSIALGRNVELDEPSALVEMLRDVNTVEADAAKPAGGGEAVEGGGAKKAPLHAGFRLPGMGGTPK